MYWPGVRSSRRGWHTSAKSSCLHGGLWQETWPSGSFASPLRYADNPGGKNTKTRDRPVKRITLLLLPVKRGTSSLNLSEWTHVRRVHSKPKGRLLLPELSVSNMSTWGQVHVARKRKYINRGLLKYLYHRFNLSKCCLLNIPLTSEGGETDTTQE